MLIQLTLEAKDFIPRFSKAHVVSHYVLERTTHALNSDKMIPNLSIASARRLLTFNTTN